MQPYILKVSFANKEGRNTTTMLPVQAENDDDLFLKVYSALKPLSPTEGSE